MTEVVVQASRVTSISSFLLITLVAVAAVAVIWALDNKRRSD